MDDDLPPLFTDYAPTLHDHVAISAIRGLTAAMSAQHVCEAFVNNAKLVGKTPKHQLVFAAFEYADEFMRQRAERAKAAK